MSTIAAIYTKALHDHFRPMYANWQPGSPMELGDYGLITNHIFNRIGNIRDEGLDFEVRQDTSADQYEFTSSSETEFVFTAAGSGSGGGVGSVKAGLEIKFSRANSVFFNAAGCRINSIRNIKALGDELIRRDEQGRWKRHFAVVTSLVEAGATTIVVAGSSNASISLEAKAEGVQEIDLADAALELGLKRQKNVAFKVVTAQGMLPLLGLMQVKRSKDLFGRVGPRRFEPSLLAPISAASPAESADTAASASSSSAADEDAVFVAATGE